MVLRFLFEDLIIENKRVKENFVYMELETFNKDKKNYK